MPRFALAALVLMCLATGAAAREPYGIGLEGFAYPHPVVFLNVNHGGEPLRMAYMDVAPKGAPNGRTALLLHGRNFPSSYWEDVIAVLAGAGWRVVVPDQIGFGKSSKPTAVPSFDVLARDTATLLDHLKIGEVDVVAHSMGGMLAVRLARAYPQRVRRLVLAAPIGLEDYRVYAPPVPTETLIEQEDRLTPDAYRRQLVTNYAIKIAPEAITPFVDARMNIKGAADYPRWLRAFVNSYQMIYREPVVYEIPLVTQPTLFIMGADDHNAPGRPFAPEAIRGRMGENAKLAQQLAAKMPEGRAEVIENAGHVVFLDAPQRFDALMLPFLQAKP
jgi:proline iminopeptidase